MQPPEMIRGHGDGIALQLARWAGSGVAVVCVHGLTANCRCWDTVAAELAGGCEMLAPDLRGRGGSDKPAQGYSIDHHVADLRHLMAERGMGKAVLMGHSLGAYICLAYAARHPEQMAGLILVDGGGVLDDEQWARVDAAIKPAISRLDRIFSSVDELLDLMRQAPFLQPWNSCIGEYFRYDLQELPGDGVRSRIDPAHIREEVENLRTFAPDACYADISCPTLVLRATDGILTPDDILLPPSALAQMAEGIPDLTCVDLPGTNHYSILFQPNPARLQAIRDFMERCQGRG